MIVNAHSYEEVEVRCIHVLSAVAVLLGSGAAVDAQAPIQLGVAGGASFYKIVGDDVDDADTRTGGHFGGVFVWQPASMLGFESGVYYAMKGTEFAADGDEGKLKLNYIEVPLMLRLALAPSSTIRPVVMLGAFAAFKASCDVEATSGGITAEMECDEFFTLLEDQVGVEAEVKSFDYGVTAGAAVDIPVGERMIISPAARYARGFQDLLEIGGDAIDAQNSGFQVGVALRFKM